MLAVAGLAVGCRSTQAATPGPPLIGTSYFGGLELGDGTIRLKPAGTTRLACPPAVMDQESRFLAALGAATAFRAEGGKLLLLDQGGRVRVRLAALPR